MIEIKPHWLRDHGDMSRAMGALVDRVTYLETVVRESSAEMTEPADVHAARAILELAGVLPTSAISPSADALVERLGRWHVGRTLGRTLYRRGQFVGTVDTRELAAELVNGANGASEQLQDIALAAEKYLAANRNYNPDDTVESSVDCHLALVHLGQCLDAWRGKVEPVERLGTSTSVCSKTLEESDLQTKLEQKAPGFSYLDGYKAAIGDACDCVDDFLECDQDAENLAHALKALLNEVPSTSETKNRVSDLEEALDALLFWQAPDGQEAVWEHVRAVRDGARPPIVNDVAERETTDSAERPFATCKHRDWTDDDDIDAPFPSGSECGAQATFLACTPSVDTPVCCQHACRCRKPLAKPTPAQPTATAPIPILLHCPECRTRHIDVGPFATKVHHTHSCQGCGLTWRPAVVPTVGVQFLPGFKNAPAGDPGASTAPENK